MVLNQLSKRVGEHGPLLALVLGLSLPIGYGIYDYVTRKKMNFISILGVLNVAFTGGFALLKLTGIWFAVKEAFFPALIGMAVFASNFFDRPFIRTLFWNTNVFQIDRIESRLAEKNAVPALQHLFKTATTFFGCTFAVSAVSNYVLAAKIFTPIDPTLADLVQSEILNKQIADMTLKGYLVIALPMTVFMAILLWYMIRRLRQITNLPTEEILAQGS